MPADEPCDLLGEVLRVADAREDGGAYSPADRVVVVEGRIRPLAFFRAGFGNVVEERGDADCERPALGCGKVERAHVVLPDGVDVVLVLGAANALLNLGHDVLQETELMQHFHLAPCLPRTNSFEECEFLPYLSPSPSPHI